MALMERVITSTAKRIQAVCVNVGIAPRSTHDSVDQSLKWYQFININIAHVKDKFASMRSANQKMIN